MRNAPAEGLELAYALRPIWRRNVGCMPRLHAFHLLALPSQTLPRQRMRIIRQPVALCSSAETAPWTGSSFASVATPLGSAVRVP